MPKCKLQVTKCACLYLNACKLSLFFKAKPQGTATRNMHNNLHVNLGNFTKCKYVVHILLTNCKRKNIINVHQFTLLRKECKPCIIQTGILFYKEASANPCIDSHTMYRFRTPFLPVMFLKLYISKEEI